MEISPLEIAWNCPWNYVEFFNFGYWFLTSFLWSTHHKIKILSTEVEIFENNFVWVNPASYSKLLKMVDRFLVKRNALSVHERLYVSLDISLPKEVPFKFWRVHPKLSFARFCSCVTFKGMCINSLEFYQDYFFLLV